MIQTQLTLYDDLSVRTKVTVMSKLEAMFDDERNDTENFWCDELERFLQFGKTYRITFEETS
jgi:hypothetical protein